MQWVRRSAITTPIAVAAAASVGAGLVHAAAAGSHNGESSIAWTFAICAVAQLAWGGIAIARPHRFVLAAGVALNAGCVVAWLLSRTVGLVGPLDGVEVVGTQDLLAAILGTIAVLAALWALVGHRHQLDIPVAIAVIGLVVVLAVPAMAAGHTHGTTIAAGATHTHTDTAGAAHDHTSTGAATGDPIVTLTDARLTKDQRQRALTLLNGTRAALAAFPDGRQPARGRVPIDRRRSQGRELRAFRELRVHGRR